MVEKEEREEKKSRKQIIVTFCLDIFFPFLNFQPCIQGHPCFLFFPVAQVSDKFAFSLFDLDWDVFMQHIEGAINRVPALEQTGIKSTVCGPGMKPFPKFYKKNVNKYGCLCIF